MNLKIKSVTKRRNNNNTFYIVYIINGWTSWWDSSVVVSSSSPSFWYTQWLGKRGKAYYTTFFLVFQYLLRYVSVKNVDLVIDVRESWNTIQWVWSDLDVQRSSWQDLGESAGDGFVVCCTVHIMSHLSPAHSFISYFYSQLLILTFIRSVSGVDCPFLRWNYIDLKD